MLTNKKKLVKNSESNDDNIQSMRSWIRNIEQSTNSIGSRLSAVEKRITLKKIDQLNTSTPSFKNFEKTIQNVLSELNESEYAENSIEYIINAFENKFAYLNDKIQSEHAEIQIINEKINELNKSLDATYTEIKKTRNAEIKILTDFGQRIEKIEKRSPPVMKIGNTEIPIELSGVIAGAISLLAAFLVSLNQQNILISPVFLGAIGLIFISSTIFKSIKSKAV